MTPSRATPRVLFQDLPVKNRPYDISSDVQNESAFALRFEGTLARLEDLRLYEPSEKPPVPWAVYAIFAVWMLWLAKKNEWPRFWILMVTLAGFCWRWKMFAVYFSLPLEGDAAGYWSLARAWDWHHPFLTGPREPGFIWLASLSRAFFGDSIRSLRLAGVLASALCIPATVELAVCAGWPFWVGLGAAALVAANPFAMFMSVQGYQLEFFTLLILLFSILWLKNSPLAMGWTGALLCVTRVQSFLAVLPLAGIGEYRRPWNARQRLLFWTPFLLMAFCYFAAVHQETGSFLGHLNRHAGYYARDNAPGNVVHFLFAREVVFQRTADLLKGYARILFDPRDPYNRILLNSHYARAWNLLWLPLFWAGLIYCLKNKSERYFLWLPLLFLSGLPMLHDLIREPRLLFHIQPFVALLTARGVWWIASARRGS